MSFRRLVLLVAVVGVAAIAVRPSVDTDTWWHLRAAQWIVENGRVPTVDSFSSTMVGSPWIYPGWLAQVVMLGFYRLAGLPGLTLFSFLLIAVAFMFLWPLLEGPVLLRAAVALLAAATSSVYWAARPHIASFALAAFFLWTLDRWQKGTRPRLVWLLPPAMLLWVNLHGGFAIGFILILMVLAGLALDLAARVLRHREAWSVAWRRRRSAVATLVAVFLLCLVAGSVNPHGPAILAYPLKTVSIPVLQAHIQEWQSPDFQSAQLVPFLVMLVLVIACYGASRTGAATTELIFVGGWTTLALLAVRNVPVFALAAAPAIARHGAAALGLTDRAATGAPRERRGLNAALGAALVILLAVWAAAQLSPGRIRTQLEAQVPVAAVESMRSLPANGNLLNDYNWGGYILWELYPAFPTFVDGRTDVFSADVFEDYLAMWTAAPGWEALAERWDIGTALLPPESPLTDALVQSGWRLVFGDDQAVVLVRPETG